MPSNYAKHFAEIYPEYIDKIKIVELPCSLNDEELKILSSVDKKDVFVHAGSFISGLREPWKTFELMSVLEKNGFPFNLISYGLLEKSIIKSINCIPNNVQFVERICGTDFLEKMGASIALILIDNSRGIQIPSKAFEYVCTGIPIIFFKSQTRSETLAFLDKVKANYITIERDACIDFPLVSRILELIEHRRSPSTLKDEFNLNHIYSLFYKEFLGV
jgi:hypothetical protein